MKGLLLAASERVLPHSSFMTSANRSIRPRHPPVGAHEFEPFGSPLQLFREDLHHFL